MVQFAAEQKESGRKVFEERCVDPFFLKTLMKPGHALSRSGEKNSSSFQFEILLTTQPPLSRLINSFSNSASSSFLSPTFVPLHLPKQWLGLFLSLLLLYSCPENFALPKTPSSTFFGFLRKQWRYTIARLDKKKRNPQQLQSAFKFLWVCSTVRTLTSNFRL